MSRRKTTIAIPEDLLAAIDRAAQSRDESRNQFIIRVLQEAVHARRDAEITKRLNDLFIDLAQEQSLWASDLDMVGTDWSEESW